MDIGLPCINGIEAARQILSAMPDAKIIFLTQESSEDVVYEAMAVGAIGYILKARAGSELLPAIAAASDGKLFVSEGLNGRAAVGKA
jgi:DNA-binding NarL/FixJ family response regulator